MSSAVPVPARFAELIAEVTAIVEGMPMEPPVAGMLSARFPAEGAWFREIEALCLRGCVEGWLCAREAGGIKFGRALKPGPETHGFSVDVVEMNDVVGPHHRHPNGEIDLVMPIDAAATFDGAPKGWVVYGAGSAHRPTVAGGRSLVLYLLPNGAIEFVPQ